MASMVSLGKHLHGKWIDVTGCKDGTRMSKYLEMQKAVQDGMGMWEKYRERCYQHLAFLVKGFISYCQIPRENITFSPLNKKAEEGTKYYLVGASHYAVDGFWHLGVCLNLGLRTALIELCVSERNGKVFVKIGRDGKQREVDLADNTQCEDFYEGIIKIVKDFFTERLQEALETNGTISIGFHS
jgi:hypothetical protein